MDLNWNRIGTVSLGDRVVRRIGFGGAWLTGPGTYGPPRDRGAARRVLRRAVAAGVQLVDTADCYGPEISETLVAEALHPYPDDVVVSSKGGRIALGANQWEANGRPEHLRKACEGSLRRLRLDAIGLYQLNAVDPDVPLEESLGALIDLRDAGMIRQIGVCNVDAAQLRQARAVTHIASVQDRYDLFARDNEPVLESCAGAGIPFFAWFPPDAGRNPAAGSRVHRVAAAHVAETRQVMLAWLFDHSPALVPLPGTPDPVRFLQDLAALSLELSREDVGQLN